MKIAIPDTTTVMSNDLKVRIGPNVTSSELGRLPKGTIVRILNRSATPIEIGGKEAYWYKIETGEGLKGWAYGAYLAVEGDPVTANAENENLEKKLKDMVMGRWYANRTSGSLSNYFVTLFANGDLEFGTGQKANQTGKFESVMDGEKIKIKVNGIEKPTMTELSAILRGETIIFSCNIGKDEYKLTLSDKSPESFKPEDKLKKALKESADR